MELSKEVQEEIAKLPVKSLDPKVPDRGYIEHLVEIAKKNGSLQCADCTRYFGIWRLQAQAVREPKTGQSKLVCQVCAKKYGK